MDLKDKVKPKASVVLVIDAQNDYCAPGGALDRNKRDLSMIQKTIPTLKSFLEGARQAKVPIIYTRTIYATRHKKLVSEVWLEQSRRRRKPEADEIYCIEGTWGARIRADLEPVHSDQVIIKHNYSAFYRTALDTILRSEGKETLILTGFTTNACVGSTAMDSFMRSYFTVVVADCVATYSAKLHEAALINIDTFFGHVTTSEEILKCWSHVLRRKNG
jgi:ureidoacrylate peracid hydrolase